MLRQAVGRARGAGRRRGGWAGGCGGGGPSACASALRWCGVRPQSPDGLVFVRVRLCPGVRGAGGSFGAGCGGLRARLLRAGRPGVRRRVRAVLRRSLPGTTLHPPPRGRAVPVPEVGTVPPGGKGEPQVPPARRGHTPAPGGDKRPRVPPGRPPCTPRGTSTSGAGSGHTPVRWEGENTPAKQPPNVAPWRCPLWGRLARAHSSPLGVPPPGEVEERGLGAGPRHRARTGSGPGHHRHSACDSAPWACPSRGDRGSGPEPPRARGGTPRGQGARRTDRRVD